MKNTTTEERAEQYIEGFLLDNNLEHYELSYWAVIQLATNFANIEKSTLVKSLRNSRDLELRDNLRRAAIELENKS